MPKLITHIQLYKIWIQVSAKVEPDWKDWTNYLYKSELVILQNEHTIGNCAQIFRYCNYNVVYYWIVQNDMLQLSIFFNNRCFVTLCKYLQLDLNKLI